MGPGPARARPGRAGRVRAEREPPRQARDWRRMRREQPQKHDKPHRAWSLRSVIRSSSSVMFTVAVSASCWAGLPRSARSVSRSSMASWLRELRGAQKVSKEPRLTSHNNVAPEQRATQRRVEQRSKSHTNGTATPLPLTIQTNDESVAACAKADNRRPGLKAIHTGAALPRGRPRSSGTSSASAQGPLERPPPPEYANTMWALVAVRVTWAVCTSTAALLRTRSCHWPSRADASKNPMRYVCRVHARGDTRSCALARHTLSTVKTGKTGLAKSVHCFFLKNAPMPADAAFLTGFSATCHRRTSGSPLHHPTPSKRAITHRLRSRFGWRRFGRRLCRGFVRRRLLWLLRVLLFALALELQRRHGGRQIAAVLFDPLLADDGVAYAGCNQNVAIAKQ